jgi:hypothetical protein
MREEAMAMPAKKPAKAAKPSKVEKPSKADLSKAGKDLRNPRTPEKRETDAAKTLEKGRKKP